MPDFTYILCHYLHHVQKQLLYQNSLALQQLKFLVISSLVLHLQIVSHF